MSLTHGSVFHLSNQQILEAQQIVKNLKIDQLKCICERINYPKKGLKGEIVQRLVDGLTDQHVQQTLYSLLNSASKGEMRRNTSSSSRHQPYNVTGRVTALSFQQQSQSGHHQNQHPIPRGFPGYNGYGGATMYSAQNLMNGQMVKQKASPRLRIVPLPFYDVMSTLMEPMELGANPGVGKMQAKMSFQFQLDSQQLHLISYKLDHKSLPRHEIQMRFFNTCDLDSPQKDDFPLNVNVRVNESSVTLPNVIPTNKPNVEAKRPSRPVCITQNCQRMPGNQRLTIDWTADKRTYAVAVYFVNRVNSTELYNRIFREPSKKRPISHTRAEIVKKLAPDDDGITLDQLKISLLCPLVKIRMQMPARCSDCTHLQCFDLNSYLMMNEKRPTWVCPVCSGSAPYDRLIIEEYFTDMLTKVDSNITEVELKQDGSFEVLKAEDEVMLSDDEEGEIVEKKPTLMTKKDEKKPSAVVDEIIILDSDDDDIQLGIENSLVGIRGNGSVSTLSVADSFPSTPATPKERLPTPPPEPIIASKSGKSVSRVTQDIEVITLDDDDSPPRKSRPPTTSSAAPMPFAPMPALNPIRDPPTSMSNNSSSHPPRNHNNLSEALDDMFSPPSNGQQQFASHQQQQHPPPYHQQMSMPGMNQLSDPDMRQQQQQQQQPQHHRLMLQMPTTSASVSTSSSIASASSSGSSIGVNNGAGSYFANAPHSAPPRQFQPSPFGYEWRPDIPTSIMQSMHSMAPPLIGRQNPMLNQMSQYTPYPPMSAQQQQMMSNMGYSQIFQQYLPTLSQQQQPQQQQQHQHQQQQHQQHYGQNGQNGANK